MALPMTGQRWASSCRLDMVPPQGDALGRADVESERRVAGEADLRNGHIALDWRRMLSMTAKMSSGSMAGRMQGELSGTARGQWKS